MVNKRLAKETMIRENSIGPVLYGDNPELTVIAEGGDGDMYGEGGNHFLHTIRRNPDIVHLVHNNMVYGLTKGQASPTSHLGFVTPLQIDGVFEEPVNPVAVAIAQNASFVARSFSNDKNQAVDILKQAIQHKGYALVDMFQPCVSFNKINNVKWFKDNTEYLGWVYTENHGRFYKPVRSVLFPVKPGTLSIEEFQTLRVPASVTRKRLTGFHDNNP